MNFSYRCACVFCFISGSILTIFFNGLFNSSENLITLTCNVQKSISNLETNLHKLASYSRTSLLLEPVASWPKFVTSTETNNYTTTHKTTEMPKKIVSTGKPVLAMPSRALDSFDKKVKLLCWILTGPKNHQKRAKNVKATWGKRCDKLLFISSARDASLPTVVIKGAKEGRNGLWSKTRGTFKLIYEQYMKDMDYFLKADDDTYVVVENLRYFLKDYKSSDAHFFGCEFELNNTKKNTSNRWDSGGAGYVLSKGAVKALVEKGYKSTKCKRGVEGGPEDVNIATCLQLANVTMKDTRDKKGGYRFLAYTAKTHLDAEWAPKWWHKFIKYPQKPGMECCSDYAVSFHYMAPSDMYLYEYLLYHLRPYGMHQS